MSVERLHESYCLHHLRHQIVPIGHPRQRLWQYRTSWAGCGCSLSSPFRSSVHNVQVRSLRTSWCYVMRVSVADKGLVPFLPPFRVFCPLRRRLLWLGRYRTLPTIYAPVQANWHTQQSGCSLWTFHLWWTPASAECYQSCAQSHQSNRYRTLSSYQRAWDSAWTSKSLRRCCWWVYRLRRLRSVRCFFPR